eukprot:5243815-Amphidinium_carterae.1
MVGCGLSNLDFLSPCLLLTSMSPTHILCKILEVTCWTQPIARDTHRWQTEAGAQRWVICVTSQG